MNSLFVYLFTSSHSKICVPKKKNYNSRDGSNQGHVILYLLLLDEFRASSALNNQSLKFLRYRYVCVHKIKIYVFIRFVSLTQNTLWRFQKFATSEQWTHSHNDTTHQIWILNGECHTLRRPRLILCCIVDSHSQSVFDQCVYMRKIQDICFPSSAIASENVF